MSLNFNLTTRVYIFTRTIVRILSLNKSSATVKISDQIPYERFIYFHAEIVGHWKVFRDLVKNEWTGMDWNTAYNFRQQGAYLC